MSFSEIVGSLKALLDVSDNEFAQFAPNVWAALRRSALKAVREAAGIVADIDIFWHFVARFARLKVRLRNSQILEVVAAASVNEVWASRFWVTLPSQLLALWELPWAARPRSMDTCLSTIADLLHFCPKAELAQFWFRQAPAPFCSQMLASLKLVRPAVLQKFDADFISRYDAPLPNQDELCLVLEHTSGAQEQDSSGKAPDARDELQTPKQNIQLLPEAKPADLASSEEPRSNSIHVSLERSAELLDSQLEKQLTCREEVQSPKLDVLLLSAAKPDDHNSLEVPNSLPEKKSPETTLYDGQSKPDQSDLHPILAVASQNDESTCAIACADVVKPEGSPERLGLAEAWMGGSYASHHLDCRVVRAAHQSIKTEATRLEVEDAPVAHSLSNSVSTCLADGQRDDAENNNRGGTGALLTACKPPLPGKAAPAPESVPLPYWITACNASHQDFLVKGIDLGRCPREGSEVPDLRSDMTVGDRPADEKDASRRANQRSSIEQGSRAVDDEPRGANFSIGGGCSSAGTSCMSSPRTHRSTRAHELTDIQDEELFQAAFGLSAPSVSKTRQKVSAVHDRGQQEFESLWAATRHSVRPVQQGSRVAVIGDGWGGAGAGYEAIVLEADVQTFTVIALGGMRPWLETHVLRSCCVELSGEQLAINRKFAKGRNCRGDVVDLDDEETATQSKSIDTKKKPAIDAVEVSSRKNSKRARLHA